MADSKTTSEEEVSKKQTSSGSSSSSSLGMKITLGVVRSKFSKVTHLSTEDLSQLLAGEANVMLFDTRPEEEFAVSHLPGAQRIDPELDDKPGFVSLIKDRAEAIHVDKDKPLNIVCYCSLGYRSSVMAERIKSTVVVTKGLSQVNVYNLDGSLFKWANEGRPMVDASNTPTTFAHPYSAVWGRLLRKSLRRKSVATKEKL